MDAHGSLVNAATVVTNFTFEAAREPLSFTRTPEQPYELFRRPSSLQRQLRLSTNSSVKKGEKKIFRPHTSHGSRLTWETFPDLLTATQTSGHTNWRDNSLSASVVRPLVSTLPGGTSTTNIRSCHTTNSLLVIG
ncbi:hypothetical protein HPB50_021992 [Hyalomma asiaticum]|uniref:Uncharacterized protein n=1 Tax=Hyalomma asiaticum TaxID=266040 RepID=A0ACB7SBI3_HYAAI|nr:hypothetical protein HPB50_021992 [Hyalomma asiaticum]